VQPVPNPNFAVRPLTTIAPSIVSRRQIKVPVNNPGIYGHNRSGIQSEAVWDIADNECMVDFENVTLVADFTGIWSDDYVSPILDAGLSGLVARLTIGTSQGLKIEEIQSYSQFSSVVQSYTSDAQRKEQSLTDGTNYVIAADKEKGSCSFFDSPGAYPVNLYIDPKKPQRVHIRFHQSSFMKNMRYLPLFLLRNGIRIQVEFENVYKAFHYGLSPSIQSMQKISQIMFSPPVSTGTVLDGAGTLQWFVANGTQDLSGNAISTTGATTAGAVNWQVNLNAILHKTNANYGLRAVHTIWFPRTLARSIFMRLVGGAFAPNGALNAVNAAVETQMHCVPIFIRENGLNVYYGLLTACKIDYAELDFTPATDGTLHQSTLARFTGTYATPTAQTNALAAIVTARNFVDSTKRFNYETGGAASQSGLDFWVPFNIEIPGDCLPYYRSLKDSTAFDNQFKYMNNRRAELLLDWNSRFTLPSNTSYGDTSYSTRPILKSIGELPLHPQIAGKINPLVRSSGWNYTLNNLELLLDLVKPSAQDFGKYMQAFQSPSGIPVAYKRVLYQSKEITSTTGGQVQFTLPFSVRSMLGCVVVSYVLNSPLEVKCFLFIQ
jgi:hypothetical protein